ncbi:MAG: DUF4358 domain-containing protein [Lachnospiraceae bacterium]|nr:DUF4358 domain-containing protein [Lachnospiraceae bacterium]
MKKKLVTVIALSLALSLCACTSGNGTDPTKEETRQETEEKKENGGEKKGDLSPETIEAAIAEALGDGYLATVDIPEDELPLSALGGLDLTKVKKYVAKQTTVPSLNLDSVCVVECEDGYAEEAVTAFNDSFNQSVSYIRMYPYGVAKVEGTRIYQSGNYVLFILAGSNAEENASPEEEAKHAASEYAKVDDAVKALFGKLPENRAVIEAQSENGGGIGGGDMDGGNGGVPMVK